MNKKPIKKWYFLEQLLISPEKLRLERTQVWEVVFANNYNTCYKTVVKYMGKAPKKRIPRWYKKVTLDPTEINLLRISKTDLAIRIKYKTSIKNINDQCWTRESNGIKSVRIYDPNRVKPDPKIEPTSGLELKRWTDVIKTKKELDYENSWLSEAINSSNSYHPELLNRVSN